MLVVDSRTVRALFERFNLFFIPMVDQMNGSLMIGACGAAVELDEVSFRSVGRGSVILLILLLQDVVRARCGCNGFRTESPLLAKNEEDLTFCRGNYGCSSPVLAEGSVCHTDAAKADRYLAGSLNDGSLGRFGLGACIGPRVPQAVAGRSGQA